MKGDLALTNNSQLSTLNSRIPKGYKQTERGVIPEDWKCSVLGKYASFKTGPFGSLLHRSDYVEGGIPSINPMQINDGKIEPTSSMSITEVAAKKLSSFRLHAGDIVIGRRGEMGRCAYVNPDQEGWLCGSGSMIIKVSPDVDAHFIQRVLSSPVLVSAIENASVGSTMINLNQSTLSNLLIALPPTIAEQNLIACALSDADAIIESLEQLLAKKRQIKQGAMQELLTGKRRVQGFSGKWHNVHLRDCLLSSPDYGINAAGVPDSGNLPSYLRITDINDDGRLIRNERVAVDHPQSFDYILSKNEIVFARTGASVGKSYLYNADDGELVFAGFLIRAKIDTLKLCPDFLAAFTRTSQYWNWVRMMSMRSGQPGINGNEYSGLNLHLPPLPEQTAIATLLSDMDLEIGAIETKLTKARQLKQGMMHELLTGRIRLIERAPS